MGRKPKCTVEEKISAVEDYLNGIRSVSEIMVDLSIKSTRTIRNWILAYQNGEIEALCSVTSTHNTTAKVNRKIEWIVLHYTAGTTSKSGKALDVAKMFARSTREASADFVVDDASIVQYNRNIANRYCCRLAVANMST